MKHVGPFQEWSKAESRKPLTQHIIEIALYVLTHHSKRTDEVKDEHLFISYSTLFYKY